MKSNPEVIEYDLDNGLHIIFKEDHFAPVVAFQMWVRVGSADEDESEAGLAHVMEHMLFKGTEKRGVGQIARDIEGAGGDVNAWTSHEETVFHLAVPSHEFDQGLDALADAVQNSALDKEELEKELEVILEEIKRGKDTPGRVLMEETFSMVFTEHPYGLPVIGSEESVKSFTREKVLDFYRKWYVPSNMSLVIAGDFDPEELKTKLPKYFNDYKNDKPVLRKDFSEPKQNGMRAKVISHDVMQAHLSISFPGVSITDEDVAILDVLGVLLGQGESARLIQLLIRDKSLVNDVFTYSYSGRTTGVFMIDMELPAENYTESLKLLSEQLSLITNEKVEEKELEKAKTLVENETIYQQQTMQGQARRVGYAYSLAGDIGFNERFLQKVRNITAEDIQRIAGKLFVENRVNIGMLWPSTLENPPEKNDLDKAFTSGYSAKPKQINLIKKYEEDEHNICHQTLPNGVRVRVLEHRSVPLVSYQAAWLAGLRFENRKNNGINNMLSRMMTLGTITKSAYQIAETIDGIAGSMSGFSGRNTLGMKGTVISRKFKTGFDLFAECMLDPAFRTIELKKEQQLVLEEIRSRDEAPARVANELFLNTLYKKHPFKMDMLGTPDSVSSFTHESLEAYYRRFLFAENLVISIVGDIDKNEAFAYAEELFGNMPKKQTELVMPTYDEAPTEVIHATKELDKQQSHIMLGYMGIDFQNEDKYVLDVMNAVLSGQGGRLFMELRDKQSLAYSIYSYHLESIDPGFIAMYIGTSPEKSEQAIAGMLHEIDRIRQGDIKEEELEHAKRYIKGSYAIGLQTNSSLSGQLLLNELYGLGYDSHLHYIENISDISVDDIKQVANRLMPPDKHVIAEVGPKQD